MTYLITLFACIGWVLTLMEWRRSLRDHEAFVADVNGTLPDLIDMATVASVTRTRLNRRAQRSESECAKLRREAVGLWRTIAYWRSEAKRLGWDAERERMNNGGER